MFHVVFRILLLVIYVLSCNGSTTSVGGERASFSAIVTCNYVVSVKRGCLFLFVLRIGRVILLLHSLGLPHNYLKGMSIRLSVYLTFPFWVNNAISLQRRCRLTLSEFQNFCNFAINWLIFMKFAV